MDQPDVVDTRRNKDRHVEDLVASSDNVKCARAVLLRYLW